MKKTCGILLAVFVVSLVGSLAPFFAILNVFYEFELITEKVLWMCLLFASICFAIICSIIAAVLLRAEKKTKLGNWLAINTAKLTLAYLLLTIFFLSIKSELVLTIADIKEIILLGWTIFGISVGIFLIWNVVVMDYLEKRKPHKPTSSFPTKTWRYIQEKGNFYSYATMLLNNINLLLVNLVVLVFVTVFVYVTYRKASVFSQSVTILMLLLCTNSIVGLLFDILKPFNEKKKLMLRETKVTDEDIDLQNKIDKESEITLSAIEAVEKMKNVSEDVKTTVIDGLLNDFSNKFGKTLEETSQTKE